MFCSLCRMNNVPELLYEEEIYVLKLFHKRKPNKNHFVIVSELNIFLNSNKSE